MEGNRLLWYRSNFVGLDDADVEEETIVFVIVRDDDTTFLFPGQHELYGRLVLTIVFLDVSSRSAEQKYVLLCSHLFAALTFRGGAWGLLCCGVR